MLSGQDSQICHLLLLLVNERTLLILEIVFPGTSLAQWLRLRVPNAGGLSSIPSMGTRSYVLQLKIPQVHAQSHQSCLTLCNPMG